jgi:hypothetical protein
MGNAEVKNAPVQLVPKFAEEGCFRPSSRVELLGNVTSAPDCAALAAKRNFGNPFFAVIGGRKCVVGEAEALRAQPSKDCPLRDATKNQWPMGGPGSATLYRFLPSLSPEGFEYPQSLEDFKNPNWTTTRGKVAIAIMLLCAFAVGFLLFRMFRAPRMQQ